ncbi:serine/threonine-protein kinase ttk/mps1, partial [Plakobranchus ocellatus]
MSEDPRKASASGHLSSDYKVQVARLAAHGNKPEEWKEYIDTVKSKVHLLEKSKQKAVVEYMYFTAFKVMPDTSKTVAYANLLVDFADFKSKYDVAEAEKLLSYARRTLRRFAIVHVASAELELKKDNKDKALKILQRAPVSGSDQEEIISLALQSINEGSNTSPSSGKELSEELNSSHLSGHIGERDLLKLSLSGCRSNTQEVQQGLDILTRHQGVPLQKDLKSSITPVSEKVSPYKEEIQHPLRYPSFNLQPGGGNSFVSGSALPGTSSHDPSSNAASSSSHLSFTNPYLKTPSPPRLVSYYHHDLARSTNHKHNEVETSHEGNRLGRQSENGSIPRQPLAALSKIPETPHSKQPSPAKKSLHRFYSTPVLNGPSSGFGSSMKNSLRKFHPRNPLPPPRRVKVDSALSSWDAGDVDTSDITESAFSLFDRQPRHSTATDTSRTHDDMDIQMEPQKMQRLQCNLFNQLSAHTPLLQKGPASLSVTQSKASSIEIKPDISITNKPDCPEAKNGQIEQHSSSLQKVKEGSNFAAEAVGKNVAEPFEAAGSIGEAKPLLEKPLSSRKVENHAAAQSNNTPSLSNMSCSESSAGLRNPERLELQQKLFQEQQEIVKQQVLEQQQQMKQYPTYSVPSQNPPPVVMAYVTPAKQTLETGQKALYVNGRPYTVIRLVGRGGSAKVYQVYDPTSNRICALKVVNLRCANTIILEGYKNEIALLKKLQHCDRVIKLFDSEYNEPTQKLLLVLEYGEIDLDKFIAQNIANDKQLLPSTIFYFWLQMVTAVHAMHEEGVIHSDLKPPNFILVAGNVKLIDFGIANSVQQDSTSVLKDIKVGTPSYMSPEMLVANTTGPADKPRYKVGKRSDVWSLGCILYQMVYGRTPFQNIPNKIEAIINPNHPIDFPHKDDPALMDVLKKCLQREVHLRPTTGELLKHPYLQIKNS